MSKLTKLRWSHIRQRWEEVKDKRQIVIEPIDFAPLPKEFDMRDYERWLILLYFRWLWGD